MSDLSYCPVDNLFLFSSETAARETSDRLQFRFGASSIRSKFAQLMDKHNMGNAIGRAPVSSVLVMFFLFENAHPLIYYCYNTCEY